MSPDPFNKNLIRKRFLTREIHISNCTTKIKRTKNPAGRWVVYRCACRDIMLLAFAKSKMVEKKYTYIHNKQINIAKTTRKTKNKTPGWLCIYVCICVCPVEKYCLNKKTTLIGIIIPHPGACLFCIFFFCEACPPFLLYIKYKRICVFFFIKMYMYIFKSVFFKKNNKRALLSVIMWMEQIHFFSVDIK